MKVDPHQMPADGKTAVSGDPAEAVSSVDSNREALLRRRDELREQRKQLKQQSNRTSRLIGEARRNGRDFEDLKTTMRACSRELKTVDEKLRELDDHILQNSSSMDMDDNNDTGQKRKSRPFERYRSDSFEETSVLNFQPHEENMQDWNAYCISHPAATIHHRYEWRGIMERSYGLETFYLSARINDRIVGILPLVRHQSRLFGDFLVSMPWFASGGAIADHPVIEQRLMQAAAQLGSELGTEHIEFRDTIARDDWPVQTHKVNMMLDLPETPEQLWQEFSSKLRAQIRRPQRENPQVASGGAELVDDFYRVYSHNMRDLGSPPHSSLFIRTILEHFPDESRIVVVRLHGRPVSAGLLLGREHTLEIPLASTIREANPLSMNMLLYWEALRFAIESGYRCFDFGRSTRDAGTFRFKKQWGARPQPLYWHYWLATGDELPSLNPHNPRYALMIALWKRLPVWLTNRLGSHLMKHLP